MAKNKTPGLSDAMNATTPKTPTPEDFINGAQASPLDADELPWSDLDPDAIPRTGLNLRLNDYQLAKIRWVSAQLDISQQKLMRRGLMPWIDARIQELLDKS